jgi:hypothetical protein
MSVDGKNQTNETMTNGCRWTDIRGWTKVDNTTSEAISLQNAHEFHNNGRRQRDIEGHIIAYHNVVAHDVANVATRSVTTHDSTNVTTCDTTSTTTNDSTIEAKKNLLLVCLLFLRCLPSLLKWRRL